MYEAICSLIFESFKMTASLDYPVKTISKQVKHKFSSA